MKQPLLLAFLATMAAGFLSPTRAAETEATPRTWKEIIAGNNLAAGRAARFAPVPLFRKTTDGTEPQKLTDGKWENEFLPASKAAVGWGYTTGEVAMIFDLGEERNVGEIVARFEGGKRYDSIAFPRRIQVLLSADGKRYFEAGSLTKVTGGEAELARENPSAYFNLPEVGTAYVHPFVMDVQRKARFVAVTVTPGVNSVFSDEVFVMESLAPAACRSLDGLEAVPLVSKGVQVRPKREELVISTNVVTPNTFTVSDLRAAEDKKRAPNVVVELPAGIDLQVVHADYQLANGIMKWKGTVRKDESDPAVNRWIIEDLWDPAKPDWQGMEGPIYFLPQKGVKFPADSVARFSVEAPDSEDNVVEAPIRFIEIPEVPRQSAFHLSLTWTIEKYAYTYPEYLRSFRHMGFSGIGVFPRYHESEADARRLAEFCDAIRTEGLEVVFNESPMHIMEQTYADKPEIYSQIDGKPGKHLCQTYTGVYYEKEMERVRKSALLIRPDITFFDIELWYRSTAECKKCSRCKEAFAASGLKDWNTFMYTQGTRLLKDLHAAIAGTGPEGRTPLAGSYNLAPDPATYHDYFEFSQFYPKYLQFAMPVLYVRGNLQAVHDSTRKIYRALGNRDSIPWITAGTYGEFPPIKVGQQILELAVNGAKGGTYYRFQDNDPMDYYYQAVALKALAPFEGLLKTGRALEVSAEKTSLACSAWGDDKETLLLFGNYREGGQDEKIVPVVSGRTLAALTDAMTGETLPVGADIIVPAGEQRLLHGRFQ